MKTIKAHYQTLIHSFSRKIIGLFLVLFFISMLIVGSVSYIIAKESLDEKGEIILENSVIMALEIMETEYLRAQAGQISYEEAEERIKEILSGKKLLDGTRDLHKKINLGDNGYFILYNLEGLEVMHPTLEGENTWDVVDYDDDQTFIVQEQIQAGLDGGGFTYYSWLYPNSNHKGRKISYAKYDENWQWIIAATAYTSDFHSAANKIMFLFLGVFFVLLISLTYVVSGIVKTITRPIIEVSEGMKQVESGHYKTVNQVHSKDEIEGLVDGYNTMVLSIEEGQRHLKERNERLSYFAYNDVLTGLPNRNAFKEGVTKVLTKDIGEGYMVQMDVRGFKSINSTFGYDVGDGLLQRIGHYLVNDSQEDILVARTSGNEFSFWMNGMTKEQVDQVLDSIHQAVNHDDVKKRVNQSIDLHIAYAKYPEHGHDFEGLYQKASMAMKHAKDQGDTKAHSYSEAIEKEVRDELLMRNHLEKAIKNKDITTYFQSKVNYKTGQVVGVEALARWVSDTLGFVSPAVFIPAVHSFFLDVEFGDYIINHVFENFARIKEVYGQDVHVAINISPAYFASDNFVAFSREALAKYGVPGSQIVYEITEDLFIDDIDAINAVAEDIRALGICLSIDDFGTGYSSMNYLGHIQLDEMKIDKAFVDDLTVNPQAVKLFKTFCNIAEVFDYRLVAEGVETKEQLEVIKATSIEIVQGYLYSKPEPLNE